MTIAEIFELLERRIKELKEIEETSLLKREYLIAENVRAKYKELIFIHDQI